MRIHPNSVSFDSASYIDPHGRVFHLNGEIYRAIYPKWEDFFRGLLVSEEFQGFMQEGKIVHTEAVTDVALEGFDLILKHKRLEFKSYAFEWPALMLKDAALLTLQLAEALNSEGITLQDANSDNVFFDRGKPVFIDFTSFCPSADQYLWAPYQEFCKYFLFPLYLHASRGSDIALRLLKTPFEGVKALDAIRVLRPLQKLKSPGYFKRIVLPEFLNLLTKAQGKRQRMADISSSLGARVDMKKMRTGFLKSLARDVERINLPVPSSHWTGYYGQTEAQVLGEKLSLTEAVLKELKPRSIIDVGCNTGEFSLLAARMGARVVSMDNDHDSVNHLYGKVKSEGLDCLPLVMDILDPSPGLGWRAREYSPATQRLKCEGTFALALIHHMVFVRGQDFDRIVQSLLDFHTKWLLVEYVDQDDPMTELLPRGSDMDYSWYTRNNFLTTLEAYYEDVKVIKQLSETRTLILATGPSQQFN